MKVRIFRQRVSQIHDIEEEINSWLAENRAITIKFIEQSSYQTDNTDTGMPGYICSIWYED